jgi:hypothetical protein
MHALIVSAFALSFIACGDDAAGPAPDGRIAEAHHEVRMWIRPESNLPELAIVEGCDRWREKSVDCRTEVVPEDANAWVYAEEGPCVVREDGSMVLAYAVAGGTVVYMKECLRLEDGSLNEDAFSTISAHEFGHQFGLWWHISERCHGGVPTHPAGERICGKALLNPYYDPNLTGPVHPDELAFDVRERALSIIDALEDGPAGQTIGPTCVYRTGP